MLGGEMEWIGNFELLPNGGQCPFNQARLLRGLEFGEIRVDDGLLFFVADLDRLEETLAQNGVKFVLRVVHRGNGNRTLAHFIVGALDRAVNATTLSGLTTFGAFLNGCVLASFGKRARRPHTIMLCVLPPPMDSES